jgi:hypothetical protein
MARTKGSKNKNSADIPAYCSMPTEERIVVLANLIVDRIVEDQNSGGTLLLQLAEQGYGTDEA